MDILNSLVSLSHQRRMQKYDGFVGCEILVFLGFETWSLAGQKKSSCMKAVDSIL